MTPEELRAERARAESVMERYFDVDIQDVVSAMDVFLDNGIDPGVAREIAEGMFGGEDGSRSEEAGQS